MTTATTTDTPTGRWTITSVIDGERAPWSSVIEFHTDHTVLVYGPSGPDGEPVFTGDGHWIERPDGTFMYYVSHPVPDQGVIHSLQVGIVDGETHSTSGSAILHLTNGSIVPPASVSLRGTR